MFSREERKRSRVTLSESSELGIKEAKSIRFQNEDRLDGCSDQ